MLTNICIFIHFDTQPSIPYYVEVYVNELSKHFDHVRLVTNERELQTSPNLNSNVQIQFEKNEGYDFGKFYKFCLQEDLSQYDEIAVVNDSNILINQLDHIFQKGRKEEVDFWGLIDSTEKPWFSSHEENYHIQSYFLVLNKKAIGKLPLFFQNTDTRAIFNTSDNKALRRLVINDWEIGLTQFLLKQGLKSYALIQSSAHSSNHKNIAHSLPEELIKEGYPLLKRKVFFKAKKNSLKSRKFWARVIQEYGEKTWDLDLIIQDLDATLKAKKKLKRALLKQRFMKWRAAL